MSVQDNNSTKKRKNQVFWVVGCGTLLVIGFCIILFLVLGGFATLGNFFGGEIDNLGINLTTPTDPIEVGDTFTISLVISNQGERNATITGIRFPDEIIDLAALTDIKSIDESLSQNNNPGDYSMNLLIAPSGVQTIEFSYEAIESGLISSNIEVITANGTTPIEFKLTVLSDNIGTIANVTPTPSAITERIPYRSVVQIVAMIEMDGEVSEGWTGSGTIISQDGLILTNAHVVLSDRYYQVVDLIVAITVAEDQPPQQMFYADVLQANADLDLAVIKVRTNLDGGPANFESLNIPPVPLGDSQSLGLGDELIIIGYPGIGGETITLTRGEVSGFTSQEQYGNRAYIKTSATFAGGNSGGLAASQQGEIIGIPTQLGSGDINVDIIDCRRLADTNRDGFIDESDNCVPTGGFINALRPINLALPLIEAAKAGEINIVENISDLEHEDYEPEGDLILVDEFINNSNNWYLDEYNEATVAIKDGQLVMDVFTDNTYVYSELMNTNYESVIIGVDLNIITPAYDGDFGFICGYLDEGNFTALEISEDGFYTIWAYTNDQFKNIVEWTESDIIPSTGPYTLSAYCGPDRLGFGVNGTLLVESNNPDYHAGKVGLIAGTYNNPGLSVGFDNFMIIRP